MNVQFNIEHSDAAFTELFFKFCFIVAKKSVTPILEAASSCAHFVIKNVLFGS